MRSMLVAIVDKGQSPSLMEKLREKGAPGGTVLHGRGTASKTLLSILGFGEARKDILISMVDGEMGEECFREASGFNGRGAVFRIREDGTMDEKWRMITVIVEKGYIDDVMAVARKAGARGGTVMNAHGTANADDVKFFGSLLVPEKEMLIIVADEESAGLVTEKVGAMKCLQEKGMGIMFTVPVADFRTLGN